MARIVGGSPIGELRGKMGGFVFSRNSAGQYVRSYVVPVDPNTIAQQRARSSFASASGSWHGLADSDKSLWNSFAKTHFNPQRGANTGQFSGINAFTALINGQLQYSSFGASGVLTNGIIPAPVTKTDFAFGMNYLPPTETLVNNIATNGIIAPGENATMSLGEVTITDEGAWTCNLLLSDAIELKETVDVKGNKFGFTVFTSEALDQPNMFVQNPYLQMLKPVFGLEWDTPASGATTFGIRQNATIDGADYRTRPSSGQYVRATVMLLGLDGQFAKVGAKVVQIP